MNAHTHHLALAYGALWHLVSTDPGLHLARRTLRDRLSNDQRAKGIAMARSAGCLITLHELTVVDVNEEATHVPEKHPAVRALRIAEARLSVLAEAHEAVS